MSEIVNAAVLLLVILNPFALSVYLVDIFRGNTAPKAKLVVAWALSNHSARKIDRRRRP